MKKMILMAIGALLLSIPVWAQAARAHRSGTIILTDDDDGKVEVWRRGAADRGVESGGTAAIRQPLFQIVFLGSPWTQTSKRDLLDHVGRMAMPDGVNPAAVTGGIEIAGGPVVNDLRIQSAIDRAMRDGSLPMREENVVYLVFLAPNLKSTLGANQAGKDYDSYHSHFHAHETNVRYVVVPWNDDAAALREATTRSALRAVLNPDLD
jgi:hypothetical protein